MSTDTVSTAPGPAVGRGPGSGTGRAPGPATERTTGGASGRPGHRPDLRTVGVEEELLLVDPRTGVPVPLSGVVVTEHDPKASAPITTELQQQQVETGTPVRTSMADVAAALRDLRRQVADAAAAAGAHVAALGTSPLPVVPQLTPDARYRRIRDLTGVMCDDHLTGGCHVHVGVASDDEGVAALDRLRPWLPVVTALATNSPFVDGRDSGYAGYRTQVWQRWPGTGPADVFGSPAEYRRRVDAMLATGVVLDHGMVYFDARLSQRYPTVEVRVPDVCLRVDDAVAVAALVRALVDTAADAWAAGEPAPPVPSALVRLASFRASRWGLTDELVHPRTGGTVPAAVAVTALVEHVRPALERSGDLDLVGTAVDELLAHGTGADRQRGVMDATGDLAHVVADAVEQTAR
ncbi:carboxylate-amine ligase [Cellulomonas carbonis]|uniref:carboxylate-amine ligase n=1 Tax=Cellulomonas carbonis TaxID=1386092 RepID=UPI000B191E01|nr:glutamate--cysteine ligase [Cellulomonas carbonis]GGB99201.1 putative glutamate--cysteine ligase 2 [Cellulomonas carbonis]